MTHTSAWHCVQLTPSESCRRINGRRNSTAAKCGAISTGSSTATRSSSNLMSTRTSQVLSSGSSIPKSQAENAMRSEEHTSELQSHSDLVCRLLLEKKKEENIQANRQ